MTDRADESFDAVERGPEGAVESSASGAARVPGADERHPSVDALRERFPGALLRSEVQAGDQHVVFIEPDRNVEVLKWLRDEPDHRYNLLVDVTAVDYGGSRPIQLVYQLWSIPNRMGLRLKCELPLSKLEIDSVVPLWDTANWLEREVYDLFGVQFRGHPDPRRILMPEFYAEGHPLRKDFPLRGRFSRAEQTRRALTQDPEDYYPPTDFGPGRSPQVAREQAGSLLEQRPDRELPTNEERTETAPEDERGGAEK